MKRRFLAGLLSLIVAANGFTPAFAGELEAAYYESETEIVAEDNPSDTEITENSEIAEEPLTEENAEPATDIDGDIIGGETSASSEISDYTEEVDLPTIEGIIPEENGLVEEPVFPEEYVAEEDPAEFEDSLSGEFVSGPLFDDSLSELEPAVMPEQEAPDDAGADEIQEEWTDGEVDVAGTAMTGICGDNLTWSLERGVLKISGTGDMWDYEWNTIPWYEKREEIVKVSIESGVTNIGAYAFYQCYNIKSIDLAESISSIKEWAFYDCDNLEKVTVPEGVKEIGFYAFHDCSALSRIDLPSSLSIIGEWAFYNCDNLKNLELPVGLTEIKTYTFAECDNLESISFPEGLTNIEGYAFFNCRGLMSLELPESVTNIGQNVFESCGRLSRITFRGDAPAFGSDCFLYGRAVAIYDPEKSGWTEEVKQKYGATLLVWSEIGEEIPDISHLCGDNLVWNLENGILTISGTGEMWNFGWNTHPWNAVWEEITEVHIESGVTSVGSYAFSECYNLRIVEIPTGITRIGNGAFNNCYSLAEIKLPASLTSIEEWAFYNCDSLKSMEIPIGITEIKPYTFHECDGMESILLPEGLTDIEGWAFSYCRRLESIVLPESLTNIGSNAFENCNRLSKMTFQGDAPVLENDCFLNNRSVAVYDPGKSGWTEEAEQSYGATLLIWKAEGEEIPDIEEFCGNNLNWSLEEGVLTIYGTGDMWNFSGNNTPWYENREKITEVHIESGVTSVGSYAFIECNNLRIIEVPMGITRIGDFAFYNCCSLVDIELPASVTSVGEWAFYNCDGLQSMEIPVGVTEIRPYTFHECGGMENILLPEGLIDIEGWAFSNCGSLESIVLPETLTNIGSNAFENCERLSKISFYGAAPVFENDCFLNNRSVAVYDPEKSGWTEEAKQNYGATLLLWKAEGEEIPDIKHFCGNNLTWSMEEGVLTISGTGEMWNFSCGNTPWNENREEIMEVHIESGVTSVGSYAFWDCNNLRTVEATEGIIKIGDCTFDNCDNLTDIVIPEGVTDIGASAFSYCCNLKSADLPSSLIFIGNNVFYNCYNLTDIELPASLTSIGEWAFYNCDGLKSMEIPVGVTEIRSYTFHECDRLDSIVLPAGLTGVEGWAFSNCRSLESIELPENLTSIGFNAFENCNKLSKVNFRGNAPVFNNDCFLNNRAVAVYNPDKSGWTEEVKQNYGATLLIWKTTGDEIPDIKNFCGNNLTWSMEEGVLTISGTGEMWNFSGSDAPWYESREEIAEVHIESGATSVGSYAFWDYDNLRIVKVTASITKVGDCAFENCDNLADIVIPEGVTDIGASVFSNCCNLKSADLPSSLKSIGNNAFYNCYSLTNIELPASLTLIGEWAFYNCDSLKSMEIPGGVTEIKPYTFHECDGMESILLPAGLTNIGERAFSYCRGLTDIELPESIAGIGTNAFEYCDRLSKMTFSGNAPVFENDCFLNNRSVAVFDPEKSGWTEEVKQKYGATLLIWKAEGEEIPDIKYFCGDDLRWNLEEGVLTISGTGEMWNFYGGNTPWNENREEIKEVHIESGATSIGSYAFWDCNNLHTVEVTEGITRIGDCAFDNCDNLTDIIIPEGVTDIGASAFSNCCNLKSVDLPSGLSSIGNNAFYDCRNLTEIELPASLTSLGEWTFYNCDRLKSMEIPVGVTKIMPYTFYECNGMESILLPAGLTNIEERAFSSCRGLTEIGLPESIADIGINAFEYCDRLSKITFSGNAPVFNNDCFLNNRSVAVYDSEKSGWTEEVKQKYGAMLLIWKADGEEIPDIKHFCGDNLTWRLEEGVLTISGTGGMWNFSGSDAPWYESRGEIKEIHIGSGQTSLGSYAFYDCYNLKSIDLPSSITSIGNYAFYNCYTLERIVLPAGLTNIETSAFSYCRSLESIELPESLKNMGTNAFENCDRLSRVTFRGAAPAIGNDCFLNDKSVAVYDPEKSGWTEEAKQNYGATLLLWKAEGEEIPDIKYFCGDNLRWNLEEGILTISGTGDMWKFSWGNSPWYENREEITEVNIESGVTSVGSYAFLECHNLRIVEVSTGIIGIEEGAFYNCDNLEAIVIPEGVTDIGASAFSYCHNLKSADLPSSLNSIDNNAFYNCYSLTEFELPTGLTSIGEWAFYNCDGLKSMEIPVGVTKIMPYTFQECDGMESILLPAGLKNIEERAFSCCRGLTEIEFPENIADIGINAFEYCGQLSKITFRGNAPVFGNDCFLNNRSVAVYDLDKSGWTEEEKQNYGATLLIWKAEGEEIPDIKYFCGDDLRWNLEEGVLTISGTGDMWNFSGSNAPWYENREEITEVDIESGATSVGSNAFWGCNNLLIAEVPEGITKIGDTAFNSCYNLTDIVLPEGVTDIGANAFSGCYNLKSTDLPSSLKSIGNNAFYNCYSLTDIELPAGLTSVGEWAFYNCDGLKKTKIPAGVTEIRSYTFYDCDGLESIVLSAGLTVIGDWAFAYCRGLTSILLPENLTSIGANAFENCSQLSRISFGGDAPVFGNVCFHNDTAVAIYDAEKSGWTDEVKQNYGAVALFWKTTDEEIPDLKHMCGNNLTWSLQDGVLTISGTGDMWDFSGRNVPWDEVKANITEVCIEPGTTSVGSGSFNNCANLRTVEVPEGITKIGDRAFDNCQRLANIVLPEGMSEMGAYVFSGCYNLKNIVLPSSITSLGEGAFYNCDGLKNVEMPAGITEIKPYTFWECDGLESIMLPTELTDIGVQAFSRCQRLTSLELPASVANISSCSFENCSQLSKIIFLEDAPTFSDDCFMNNRSVAVYDPNKSGWTDEVKKNYGAVKLIWIEAGEEIPDISHFCGDNLTWSLEEDVLTISGTGDMWNFEWNTIPWYAAREDIKVVYIDSGVTSVGANSFNNCVNLTTVEIPEGITKIGNSAFNCCQSLTDTVIPEGVTEIGANAFSNCYNLKTLVMPSSLTSVGEWAFYSCYALENMEIPVGITQIKPYTFRECNGLKSILLPAGLTSIEERAFSNCRSLTTLELPESLSSVGPNAFEYCDKLSPIIFQGDVPAFGNDCFLNNRSVVVYDPTRSGWTESVKKKYGAKLLIWRKVGEEIPDVGCFCGDNLTWSLEEGVLTISGTGDMWDFDYMSAPWYEERGDIIEVHVEPGVTNVGSYAFYDYWIKKVELPESIREIRPHAFSHCHGLTGIKLPSGITSIGEWAFYECNRLKSVEIPIGVTDIRDFIFSSCTALESIVLPNGLTNIGAWAFSGCERLSGIAFPNGLRNIGTGAFSGCKSFTGIELSESVTNIDTSAFENCSDLSMITFRGDAPVFGDNCFLNNISVAVYDPEKTSWTEEAKQNHGATYLIWKAVGEEIPDIKKLCGNDLTWDLADGVLTITGTGEMWDFTRDNTPWREKRREITDVHIELGVTSIGSNAFYNCRYLKAVEVPEGITQIGDGAYCSCHSLKNIVIPESVMELGSAVFYDCYNLESIDLPSSIVSIGDTVFYNCYNLKSIDLPSGIKSIGRYAFYNCSGLKTVEIPVGVTELRYNAFYDCAGLENITLPEGVQSIESHAFLNCRRLISIDLPESIKDIGYNAFENCSKLTRITFRGDVPSFGDNCFLNLRSIAVYDPKKSGWTEKVKQNYGATLLIWKAAGEEIPDIKYFCGNNLTWNLEEGLLTITGTGDMWDFPGDNTPWFEERNNITEVHIGSGVTSIGSYAFKECNNLNAVEIPEGIVTIGDGAFENCRRLTDIELPVSIRTIGVWAFRYCYGLNSIEIPVGITEIGSCTFYYCTGLKTISLPDGLIRIEEEAFSNCSDLTSLELPESIISIGRNAFAYCNQLSKITFQGSAPRFGTDCFLNNKSLAVYDPQKAGWTENVKQNYGAKLLVWRTAGEEIPEISQFCGNNLTWKIEGGVLTIYGTGDMINFGEWNDRAPWYELRSGITEVNITSGVTGIGAYAFKDCKEISRLTFQGNAPVFNSNCFKNIDAIAEYDPAKSGWTVDAKQGYGAYRLLWKAKGEENPDITLYCGTGLTWSLDSGVLSISGKGEMWNFNNQAETSRVPWYENRLDIKEVHFDPGVTSIGEYAFEGCENLINAELPSGLLVIERDAFRDCTALKKIVLPAKTAGIKQCAFEGCENLSMVLFVGNAPEIDGHCFSAEYEWEYYNTINSIAVYDPERIGWTEAAGKNYGAKSLRWMTIDEYNKGFWFEKANMGDFIRLFSEGCTSVRLNKEILDASGADYEQEISLGYYKNGEWVAHEELNDAIRFLDNEVIELDGTILSKHAEVWEDKGRLQLAAVVRSPQEGNRIEVIDVETWNLSVKQEDWNYPWIGVRDIKSGESISIDSIRNTCRVQVYSNAYPEGAVLWLPIKDVSIETLEYYEEGEGEPVTFKYYSHSYYDHDATGAQILIDEEAGWTFFAGYRSGLVDVKLLLEDDKGNQYPLDVYLNVISDEYIPYVECNPADKTLRPGETAELEGSVEYYHFIDDETKNNREQRPVGNITWEWSIDSGEENVASFTPNGNKLVLTAADIHQNGKIQVTARAYSQKKNGESFIAAEKSTIIDVAGDFYEISVPGFRGALEVKTSMTVTPSLTHYYYENGQRHSENMIDSVFDLTFDPNVYQIKDSEGNELSYDTDGNSLAVIRDIPSGTACVMERLIYFSDSSSPKIKISAYSTDAAGIRTCLAEKECSLATWYYGARFTDMNFNDHVRLFNDGSTTFRLEAPDYEVDYKLGYLNNGLWETHYELNDGMDILPQKRIKLDGTVLSKHTDVWKDKGKIQLKADVKDGDVIIYSETVDIEMWNAGIDKISSIPMPGEAIGLAPGKSYTVDSYLTFRYYDTEHTGRDWWENDAECRIQDINVETVEYYGDGEGEPIVISYDTEYGYGMWTLAAGYRSGLVKVNVVFEEDLVWLKNYYFYINVTREEYNVEIHNDKEDIRAIPGETVVLEAVTTCTRHLGDKNNNRTEEGTVENITWKWDLSDTGISSSEADGNRAILQIGEVDEFGSSVYVGVTAFKNEEGKEPYEVARSTIYVKVQNGYEVKADGIDLRIPAGKSTSFTPTLYHTVIKNGKRETEVVENAIFGLFDYYDRVAFTIKTESGKPVASCSDGNADSDQKEFPAGTSFVLDRLISEGFCLGVEAEIVNEDGERIHVKSKGFDFLEIGSVEASNISLNASATESQTAMITVKENKSGGDLSYKSDNASVTVNSSGKVTVAKNFAGTAKITVKSAETNWCTAASTTITVTVNKIAGKVAANNFTRNAAAKEQSFSIGAKRLGAGKLTYKSNVGKVTISSSGKVTIPANYTGKATITITAAESGIYKAASKKITVTVNQIAGKVTAQNFTKNASAQAQSFSIGAKRLGGGKLTYACNTSKVKISTAGKVTIPANYSGIATITIKVSASGIYKAASTKITLTVKPQKPALSSLVNSAAGKMTVTWKKIASATGYQLQYATNSGFTANLKKVTITDASMVSKVIGSLKKGNTYYVRIRTYKTADGKTLYSGWSTVKTLKIVK